jgi:hypothetical protein
MYDRIMTHENLAMMLAAAVDRLAGDSGVG